MSCEKLHSLIERLNVNGVKSDLSVVPEQNFKGEHDIIDVICFSDNEFYIRSLARGMQQFFGETPEVKSEVKLTTPAEFFKPTKPQQYFHHMTISNAMLLKLCEKFNVSFNELKEECRPKIQENPYKNEIKGRYTL